MNLLPSYGVILAMLLLGITSASHAQPPMPERRPQVAQPQPVEAPVRSESSGASAVVAVTNSMDVLDTGRKIGPGDRLSYRVVEERRTPMQLQVTDGGEVEVPLIGRVQAKGRTCRELAYAIKPMLEKVYFQKATVIISVDTMMSRSIGKVYLSGQVMQQGGIEIPPDERFTLSKAIFRAGGFANFANQKKIKLVRRDPATGVAKTTIVDMEPVTKRGEMDKDPLLLPDDTVIVPEKFINF